MGKLISAEGNAVKVDRLGSVRNGGPGNLGYQAQYPYGVEYTTTANDREKYATYTRDSVTGLDYAMNRYYASQWGRFLSPDPRGGRISDPRSLNRYGYVRDDPVNRNDPSGLCDQDIAGIRMSSTSQTDFATFAENAVAVYPYSPTATGWPPAAIFLGVLSVASQTFGATSATYAAVAGLLVAYSQGGPINVTTYSGGAQAFTQAVSFLSSQGESAVVNDIDNITYISPGATSLYNNGNGAVILGGGPVDTLVTSALSGWQGPIYSASQCIHGDFACMWQAFQGLLASRSGAACSQSVQINANNNSWLHLLQDPTPGLFDPFYYLYMSMMEMGVGVSELPDINGQSLVAGGEIVTSTIHWNIAPDPPQPWTFYKHLAFRYQPRRSR